jgi:hypothetical protein
MILRVSFSVPRDKLSFRPDEKEIIFYTPEPSSLVEDVIDDHLEDIKNLCRNKGYRFTFLPDISRCYSEGRLTEMINYFNPRKEQIQQQSQEFLSYSDIKTALAIPQKVDAPCFIRCKVADSDPLTFTFWEVEVSEKKDILEVVREYLGKIGDGKMYNLTSDDRLRASVRGLAADERFDIDIYLIGKEIRERIEQLRAKGLSSLAIKKLIGDDSDKPGRLLIDRQNRLILTDYGNREIKLSPIHKAVFFLFLRHPEGIYFKDLGSYRDELGKIYREITGREDMEAVEESINKLTDPLDNSINEKCARIKNAFVSEFREEVAQWYFIDGRKGEKKSIKLPRELVMWEIKK